MSDLGRNIRLIAETEKLQRQINDLLSQVQTLKDKDAKLGDRSTATQSAATGGVNQKSGDKLAQQVAEVVEEAVDDIVETAIDLFSDEAGNIDGTGGEQSPNKLDSFSKDLADLETTSPKLGSKMLQLTGIEEVGGTKESVINLDGEFVPPLFPGSGFENYNADIDPREDNFVQGIWYSTTGAYESSNPFSSAQAYATAVLDVLDAGNAPHTAVSVPAFDPNTDSTVNVLMNRVAGTFEQTVNINTSGCTVGADAWCPSLRPVGDWDEDDIQQLAFNGAQYLTSTLEAAADTLNSWTDSPSVVSGETSNNTGVTIAPTDTGGTTVTYTGGNSFTLDNNGTVISKNY